MKHQKALARLGAKPPPSNFKWLELVSVLRHLGFDLLTGSGSRRKFFHREKNILIIGHQPQPSPNVDKACVVDVINTLREHGLLPK
ncbi:MAG: type II toxin-antitoxin system HicA family toxin [Betaproteobacteria bacterium]